jgi:hypothetical protein
MTDEPFDPKLYLNVTEAAKFLKLSSERIREFCREGRMGRKVLGVWMLSKEEVKAFAKLDRPEGRRPDGVPLPQISDKKA